jgi:ATP-dependent DNA helicase RecG
MSKEVEELIEEGESQNTEFKDSLSLKREIGETVSAFSNAHGGTILIGISDLGDVTGVEVGKRTLEELANYLKLNTDPQIYPEINLCQISDKDIIEVKIKENDEKPVFFKTHAFKRVGRTNQRISTSEIRKLAQEERKRLRFDERICEEASLDDIDEKRVRRFLKDSRKQRGLKISEDASIEDAFLKLKLLKNGKPTNAALLLFSKEPIFLQSEVKCIRFKSDKTVKPYADFQTLEGTVIDLVDNAVDFVLRNIRKTIWLVPGKIQREERYEYPEEAIRESIVNAIVHRDYSFPSKVQVRIFDSKIEIWNPGELPKGWTVENLKEEHESIPMNPLLFRLLFWIRYVEDVGGGTIDMINWCRDFQLPDPEFKVTGTSFVVTFRRSKLTEEYLKELGLNERQKNAIDYIKEKEKITNKEYRMINNVSHTLANHELKDLVEKEILMIKGKGRATQYFLKS